MTDFSNQAKDNMDLIRNEIEPDRNFDILERNVEFAGKNAGFFFIDGFVEADMAQKLMQFFYGLKEKDVKDIDSFLKLGFPYTEVSIIYTTKEAITLFLSGVTLCFIDGFSCCIAIDCRTYPMRGVEEPWKDKVLRGSRDGFVETLVFNAALIRRRIRDTRLSFEMFQVGTRSKTDVCLCYLDDKVERKVLDKIRDLINDVKVDALTMNMESLAECLYTKKWISPFPKFKYSERPDTASAAVLEGNIIIMVDNSPAVMIIPTTIFDIIEEPDDYTFSPVVGTYLRWSKYLFTLVTLLLTPVWLLLINNPQWIPKELEFITITDDVMVPVFLQLILLELAIDGLKIAAVNTPNLLTTPLSIVAGIVVGEYAVSSGWFNAESMLYMAIVTVGTYSQSSFELGFAMKFYRVLILCLTQWLNLWGFIGGIVITLLSVVFNNTLSGKSYIYPIIPFNARELKRRLIRVRLHQLNK